MSRPGPRRTPTDILKIHGSTVPGRDRHNEPKPKKNTPVKPRWLTGEPARVWKQVITQLKDMGVLTVADGNAIARYCELLVRWVDASKFIRDNKETYVLKDSDGKPKCVMQWPQVSIVNQLSNQILRLEQEFGLTPSSRASLKVEPTSTIATVATRNRHA